MNETIKINLRTSSQSLKKKSVSLDGYIEIEQRYLKFLKGCWIKYTDKNSFITYSGGFLIGNNETFQIISLRNVKGEITELEVDGYLFYCKEDLPQYELIKELLHELEALRIEKKKLLQEKRDFFLNKKNK